MSLYVRMTPHSLLVPLVMKEYSYTSTPPMGGTACTEPQCLYKGALYLYCHLLTSLHLQQFKHVPNSITTLVIEDLFINIYYIYIIVTIKISPATVVTELFKISTASLLPLLLNSSLVPTAVMSF